MTETPMKPRFVVLPSKAGGGKHNVWLEWPNGDREQIGDGFDTEVEAKLWVKNDSEAWLAKHPKNQT
jgi:hypothetical protein